MKTLNTIIIFAGIMLLSTQLPANQNLIIDEQAVKEMQLSISANIETALNAELTKVPQAIKESQEHIKVTIKFIESLIGAREAFNEDTSNLKDILAEYNAFLDDLNAENYDINILQEHIGNLNYYINQVPEYAYKKYYAYRIGGALYFLKADNKLVNMAYLMKSKQDEIQTLSQEEAPLLHYVANQKIYSKRFLKNFALDKYVVQIVKMRYPHLDEE